jgi:N-acetylmuramoyl-L-alanine amidase
MDEATDQNNSGILPLALAVLAIVVGGAGLYFGLTVNKTVRPLAEAIHSEQGTVAMTAEQVDSLEAKIKELADQNKELNSALSRLRAYGNERDKRLKALTLELNKQGERLTQAPRQNSSADIDQASAFNPTAVGAGNYMIQAGDTLSKIATQSGVDLKALMDANPGVDPRRLRIGQAIVIPSNQ